MATETGLPIDQSSLHPFLCEICGKQIDDTIIATEHYKHDRSKPFNDCISYVPDWE